MDWTLPILAKDSFSEQHIEVETKTAVLVSAKDHGKLIFVAVNHRLFTYYPLPTWYRGEMCVVYDRPEAFSDEFRTKVRGFFANRAQA